ncbi:hypothetical protein OHC33_006325 [Knufia fluminis]|uniref:Uncharacterized protein n=1 Tax=Knufia fluminis TaxID=191047 RepID=A0AAN8IM23_9EURO|nr:hypothetical protein OHC33_006325 [Knufia fluminis]
MSVNSDIVTVILFLLVWLSLPVEGQITVAPPENGPGATTWSYVLNALVAWTCLTTKKPGGELVALWRLCRRKWHKPTREKKEAEDTLKAWHKFLSDTDRPAMEGLLSVKQLAIRR